MVSNINNTNLDAAELFNECLAQATTVVKQIMPAHYTNATPDTEADVRDVTNHMLSNLELVTATLAEHGADYSVDSTEEPGIDRTFLDLSAEWQTAADNAEATISEIDLDDTVSYNGEKIDVETFLTQLAGDLLIHAWDLGEAIGMPIRFENEVAEAIMETTVVPNKVALPNHNLFVEPISPPANADLQARLLALFGRSHAWRTAN